MIDESKIKKGDTILLTRDTMVPVWESYEKGTHEELKEKSKNVNPTKVWIIAQIVETNIEQK